jgi:hypothetical protein
MLDSYLLGQWNLSSPLSNEAQVERELDQARVEWLADGLLSIALHSEAACWSGNFDYGTFG